MNISDKLKSLEELVHIRREARAEGRRVVWTNGCFDILHAGHVLYLQAAKACGDLLVVGVNSDASVRRTKGPKRPIVNQQERLIVLAALTAVDYLVLFDDNSPLRLIAALEPDVYVKGGDYNLDTINQEERRLVESYGGSIELLPGVPGVSTSSIIDKVLQAYR